MGTNDFENLQKDDFENIQKGINVKERDREWSLIWREKGDRDAILREREILRNQIRCAYRPNKNKIKNGFRKSIENWQLFLTITFSDWI